MPYSPVKKAAVLTGLIALVGGGADAAPLLTNPQTKQFSVSGTGTQTQTLTFQPFTASGTLTSVDFFLNSNFTAPAADFCCNLALAVDGLVPDILFASPQGSESIVTPATSPIDALSLGLPKSAFTSGSINVEVTLLNFDSSAATWVGNTAKFTGLTLQYDYTLTTAAPLPATLPLFVSGLGALGLLGWRRKRNSHVGTA